MACEKRTLPLSPLHKTDGAVFFQNIKRKRNNEKIDYDNSKKKCNELAILKKQIIVYFKVSISVGFIDELEELIEIISSFDITNSSNIYYSSVVPNKYESYPIESSLYEDVKIWCNKASSYNGLLKWAITKGNIIHNKYISNNFF